MGGQIPRPIKVEVIRKWLDGKSRDQIANEVGIGAGTVSTITNECRQNDPQFDLMRECAVKLKNQGHSIESFAPLVRLREILRKLLLDTPMTTAVGEARGEEEGDEVKTQQEGVAASKMEEKIESLVVALQVFCFKQNRSIKEFVDVVHYLTSIAERFGIPLEKLHSYVEELASNADKLAEEIEQKSLEKQEALEDHDITSEVLDEYTGNRPLFETNQKLRAQLDKVTKERDTYRRELEDERIGKMVDKEVDSINMGISEEVLDEVNAKLGGSDCNCSTCMTKRLNPDKLQEMVMRIYHNPAEYIDIIKQLMKT
jgi:hypothetical protein